jgi:hypothetical protein
MQERIRQNTISSHKSTGPPEQDERLISIPNPMTD